MMRLPVLSGKILKACLVLSVFSGGLWLGTYVRTSGVEGDAGRRVGKFASADLSGRSSGALRDSSSGTGRRVQGERRAGVSRPLDSVPSVDSWTGRLTPYQGDYRPMGEAIGPQLGQAPGFEGVPVVSPVDSPGLRDAEEPVGSGSLGSAGVVAARFPVIHSAGGGSVVSHASSSSGSGGREGAGSVGIVRSGSSRGETGASPVNDLPALRAIRTPLLVVEREGGRLVFYDTSPLNEEILRDGAAGRWEALGRCGATVRMDFAGNGPPVRGVGRGDLPFGMGVVVPAQVCQAASARWRAAVQGRDERAGADFGLNAESQVRTGNGRVLGLAGGGRALVVSREGGSDPWTEAWSYRAEGSGETVRLLGVYGLGRHLELWLVVVGEDALPRKLLRVASVDGTRWESSEMMLHD